MKASKKYLSLEGLEHLKDRGLCFVWHGSKEEWEKQREDAKGKYDLAFVYGDEESGSEAASSAASAEAASPAEAEPGDTEGSLTDEELSDAASKAVDEAEAETDTDEK